MIIYSRATRHGVEVLSKKLLKLMDDKEGQVYQENVAKFGIPEEYVRMSFAKETLLKQLDSGKTTFYLALENRCKIIGFAQTVKHDESTVELDRIVIFPEHTGKGVGTQLLAKILRGQKRKGFKTLIVNAGKDETLARRFYEKNGFVFFKDDLLEAPWGSIPLATYKIELT